jgi:hypothetical protein
VSEFVARFATTPERRDIVSGFLRYRRALRGLGITAGFQLVDGSFLEKCEELRNRAPSDLDLVTFAYPPVLPAEIPDFLNQNRELFDRDAVKLQFKCDSFFVNLAKDARYVVVDTMYWYGLFSHQRDTFLWKGMLTIPLMSDDEAAAALLPEGEVQDA